MVLEHIAFDVDHRGHNQNISILSTDTLESGVPTSIVLNSWKPLSPLLKTCTFCMLIPETARIEQVSEAVKKG